MPFNITCVRCGDKIATIEKNKIRDWVQTHDLEVCKLCQQKEEKLRSFFAKQKNLYVKRLDEVLESAVKDLNEQIRGLSDGVDRAA